MRAIFCFILFSLTAVISASTFSDKGWESIKNNDNRAARQSFIDAIKNDSIDIDALQGLIYLNDIEQNTLGYNKYVATLLRNYPNDYLLDIFDNRYQLNTAEAIKSTAISERCKFPYKLQNAMELQEKRAFKQADDIFAQLLPNYKWRFIGPFKNISGSGHAIPTIIEQTPFDTNRICYNYKQLPVKWVQPTYINTTDKIKFTDYLPTSQNGAVYYANTFINNPTHQTVQIRISRSAPIKIWLDDFMILINKEKIDFKWDDEIITLDLEPGTHRILIKCESAPKSPQGYPFLEFADKKEEHTLVSRSLFSNYGDGLYDDADDLSFAIRITDNEGNLLKNSTATSNNYKPGYYRATTIAQPAISYFLKQVEKNPDNLFNYYALCKAYMQTGLAKQAEVFFVKKLRTDKDRVFFKYLVAKIYARNGKIEKAYQVLSEINHTKTPIFGFLYEKFKEIDLNSSEEKYIEALDTLKKITPANYGVISAYLKYYDKKGLQQIKNNFIKDMRARFPEYASSLNYELDESAENKETNNTNYKNEYNAANRINKYFNAYDYTSAIANYKTKNKYKKIIELYDELIQIMPHVINYRQDKGQYLKDKKQFPEALQTYINALAIAPYNAELFESIGDLYNDKSTTNTLASDSMAIVYYNKAKVYGSAYSGIQSKIDKLIGQRSLKSMFDTKTFNDVLIDFDWQKIYKNEESVILLYTRDLVNDTLGHVEVFQQMMIKIMNDNGVKRWTEYDFSFMGNINTLRIVKPNGTEISPDKQGGYVVSKNLEPGDIIMIDGTQEWEQFSELGKELYLTHFISFEAPIYYHKFEVAIPRHTNLEIMYHNLKDTVQRYTKNEFDFYKWEYYNIPKIETEDATLDMYDMYSSIMISTMPNWSSIVKWYDQTVYDKLDMTYEVKEALDSIIKPGMREIEKVETVYNYLTKEIKYSYVPFLQSGYVPKAPGLSLSSRIGDCKDVATLMITMLNDLGIESYYTLVKTNAYNHQEMLPSIYFDHVIVQYQADGKIGYLDMTTDFYPYYVLTENDVNAWGLVVKDGERSIFRLPNDDLDSTKNKTEYIIHATLNTDKSIDIKANATYPGIAGGSMREIFSNISEQEKKNYIADKLGKGVFTDVTLTDQKFENNIDISKPLKAQFTLHAADFSDEVANLLICRIPYMTGVLASSAISSKQRINRINTEKLGNIEPTLQKIYLTLPANYKLLQLPQPIDIKSKYGSYKVQFKKTATGVYIEKYQSINTKIIERKEFQSFKDFYVKLLNADKTKIAIQQKL